MYKFKSEIKKEIIKACTIKFILAILFCVIIFCIFNLYNHINSQYSGNWRKEIQEEINLNKEIIDEMGYDLDEDTFENLVITIRRLSYYLKNNISPNTNVLEFIHDSIDVNFFLILLSVFVFAKVLCIENTYGTEKIYLARNVAKPILICSKLIASFIIVVLIHALLMIISFILGLVFFGKNGIGWELLVFNIKGDVVTKSYFGVILNAVIINMLLLLLLTAMTSLISVISKKQLFAVLIPFLIWNFGGSFADTSNWIPARFQPFILIYPLNYFCTIGTSEIAWDSKETAIMTCSILFYSALLFALTIFIFIKQSACGGKMVNKNKVLKENYL